MNRRRARLRTQVLVPGLWFTTTASVAGAQDFTDVTVSALLQLPKSDFLSEKMDLEQRVGEVFARRDHRARHRINRELERVRVMLEDLYKQWTVEA